MTSLLRSLASRLSTYSQNILFRQDHFAPHEGAGFEGYYSRTQLEDGSTLAVIFCWVKNAPRRRNLVHVSYTPSPSSHSSLPAFKHEFFPERHEITSGTMLSDGQRPFAVHMPGIGTMKVNGDTAEYVVEVSDADLRLSLTLTQRLPWSSTHRLAGPMGIFSVFSSLLPLNWHVHSTSSKASYSITHSGTTLSGSGTAHFEKNWGIAFPPGWIWSQSFAGDRERTRSLCLAGGCALPGVQAYLLGYRSPSLHWDFRPPFTVGVGPISPFIDVAHDSKAGTFRLAVQTFTRKLVVRVNASPDSFLGIAAPYADGHRPNFAFESFSGSTWVEAWGRAYPWQSWTLLEEGDCGVTSGGSPCSALEFGGSFSHLVETENAKTR